MRTSARKITQDGYESCGTSLAPRGSIVISTRAPIGHIAVLDQPACVNQGCKLLVLGDGTDDTHSGYIYFLLKSIRQELQSLGVGTTFNELSRTRLGNLCLTLPPLPEQVAIARFLGRMDRRITRYIAAKEKLVALLEEYGQVLVSDAVTGRFDVCTGKPYPAYKPSGIEWLGDVPTHWEIQRLKTWLGINELVLPEHTDAEYTFAYLDIGAVETGRLVMMPKRIRFGDSPSRARRIVRAGDTLVSTVRTYLKAVWWYEGEMHSDNGDLIASTGFAVLTPRHDTCPKFVSYVCQSDPFTDRVTANSVGTAYPAIIETNLGTFNVCVPPLSEQAAIARFLDQKIEKIGKAINRAQGEIDLLREYRTRFIADVVTGKLDVRNAATELSKAELAADEKGVDEVQSEAGFHMAEERILQEENSR